MYADPKNIRKKRINLSLTDTESRLIEALAEINGTQPSVFIREFVLEAFAKFEQVGHASNSGPYPRERRATH